MLYVFPDGHSNFYFMDEEAKKEVKYKNMSLSYPTNNVEKTIQVFIDIITRMRKKAQKLQKKSL